MNKLITPAIALVAALGIGAWWYAQPKDSPAPLETTQALADTGSTHQIHPLDMPLGNPDAPVVVIEYSSYTCPHCATFALGPFQQIKEEFIDTGRILYLKREVYFDRFGLWAAMVARCGGEDRFHGVLELIYEQQQVWATANDPAQVANNLRRIGLQAGLERDQIDACLADSDKALKLTEFYQQNAEADNVRSTPTFIINGQQFSNMPLQEFQRILNDALGG